MKLVFPNGEHGAVLLSPGVNRIGTAPNCAVVLGGDAIHPVHCEIHLTAVGANLQVPAGGGAVALKCALRNAEELRCLGLRENSIHKQMPS